MALKFLITDGSDLTGVERTEDIKYMRLLRFNLKVLFAWPVKQLEGNESAFVKVGRIYTTCLEAVADALILLYIKTHFTTIDFLHLGHLCITGLMSFVSFSRTSLLHMDSYFNMISDFVTKIHLFNHKDQSENCMKIHLQVHKISHFCSMFLMLQMYFGFSFFTIIPLTMNLNNGAFHADRSSNISFKHSVYLELPLDSEHDTKSYFIVFVLDWYLGFMCSTLICTFDLTIGLMVFHLWGHLKILLYKLEHFPRPASDGPGSKFLDHEMENVYNHLTDIVQHHNLILQFTRQLSDTMGPILLIYLAFHQAICCILMLVISQLTINALIQYGLLTMVIFQELIQISVVFEILYSTNDKLQNAIYNLPWECMSASHGKIVLLLLQQSQIPKNFKFLGVEIGVKTMASIIRTSISYFVLLRSRT